MRYFSMFFRLKNYFAWFYGKKKQWYFLWKICKELGFKFWEFRWRSWCLICKFSGAFPAWFSWRTFWHGAREVVVAAALSGQALNINFCRLSWSNGRVHGEVLQWKIWRLEKMLWSSSWLCGGVLQGQWLVMSLNQI